MARVNVNFSDDLLSKIDYYADYYNVSRSAFISFCCSCKLNVYNAVFDSIDRNHVFIDEGEE